ncbi:MAG: hypothetical protein ACI8TQ_003232 [Planctomycetota bacterium]|jgi:hypothetical protein
MKSASKFFVGLIALLLIGIIAVGFLFERVPPAVIGVKLAKWGGGGIVKEDYGLGFKWGVTGYHQWYFLDKRTHFLTFSKSTQANRVSSSERVALGIRTKDNNTAYVDATITYRIIEGEGHEIVIDGLLNAYRDRVTSTVESVLRAELAQLTSEDFTSTNIRMQRAATTLPILATAMEAYHVEPIDLLIRAVHFPPEYEAKLQEKQLTQQKALLAYAQEKVENQEQVTGVISKETEALEKEARAGWNKRLQNELSTNEIKVATINGEAEVYQRRTRSEADADYQTAIAEGELALAKAEAVRNDLRNKALDTTGGRILLASQAAENLRIDEVTLNSNDPSVPSVIDIAAMVRLLLGQ